MIVDRNLINGAHWFYRRFFSPALHLVCGGGVMGCRFVPTCGEYFFDAVRIYGSVRGSIMGAKRVMRCHPFARAGFDPLPTHRTKEGCISGQKG